MKDSVPFFENPISEDDVQKLNPLVLAFVGDAVQQLYVRTRLCTTCQKKAGELHKLAIQEIKATAQADFMDKLLPYLNENEMAIFKRARNTHYTTAAKNASIADYKKASGFEAVIGYLYLTGKHDRLDQIFEINNIKE